MPCPVKTISCPVLITTPFRSIQANAAFFLHRQSRGTALDSLRRGRIHFLGTDCHDLIDRPPNMGYAMNVISDAGAVKTFERFNERVELALKKAAV